MSDHDFVRVTNLAADPLVAEFRLKPVRIKSGESIFMGWDCARYLFGDPNLYDDLSRPGFDMRQQEVQRVDNLYGIIVSLPEYQRANRWPNVSVESLSGEPIIMLIHDPRGDLTTDTGALLTQSQANDNQDLKAQMAVMQAALDRVTMQLAQATAPIPGSAPHVIPTPTPTPIPTPTPDGFPSQTISAPSDAPPAPWETPVAVEEPPVDTSPVVEDAPARPGVISG